MFPSHDQAAKSVGIGRDTHYRWMREDPDYRKEVESVEGIALDFAESGLHEQIMDGNITAIIFYLKTKGKVRGYIERSEVVQKDDKPDLSDLSTEDLIKLVKEAEES